MVPVNFLLFLDLIAAVDHSSNKHIGVSVWKATPQQIICSHYVLRAVLLYCVEDLCGHSSLEVLEIIILLNCVVSIIDYKAKYSD